MNQNNELEEIGGLIKKRVAGSLSSTIKFKDASKNPPAYIWQDLALKVIKELNIPNFKRSAVFKVCKEQSRNFIEKCLNDTKELCRTGKKWKYFFKVVGGKAKK